jgi:hypothetical protein
MRVVPKILIGLAAATIISLAPMLAEQADAQRFGRGGGGIGRIGIGGGVGRIGGWGGGIGRVGWGGARVGGLGWGGRGLGWGGRGLGWGGRAFALGAGAGVARAAWWGGRPGLRRAAWWGGNPGWRFRRAAWWGGPLAFGLGVGALSYGSSCLSWDPYYGQYVNVCYSNYGYGWGNGYW